MALIIKPKKKGPAEKFPLLKKILNEAENTGRCLVFKGDIFPNEAGYSSDLAIGLSVASSTSIETALAGIPTLIYDPEQSTHHAFYTQGGHNKIIFDNDEEIFRVIEIFRRKDHKKIEAMKLGDFSFILKNMDQFQDKKASLRTGAYIYYLLHSFIQGMNKEAAIQAANVMYKGKFGEDTITTTEEVLSNSYAGGKRVLQKQTASIIAQSRWI